MALRAEPKLSVLGGGPLSAFRELNYKWVFMSTEITDLLVMWHKNAKKFDPVAPNTNSTTILVTALCLSLTIFS